MCFNAHMPANFHAAVANWFDRTFPAPTPAQEAAWPAIAAQRHVLIAAPTGSGKTLAAFLAVIDALVREGLAHGALPDEALVVYVSPPRRSPTTSTATSRRRLPASRASSRRSACRCRRSAPSYAPATPRSTSARACAASRRTSW